MDLTSALSRDITCFEEPYLVQILKKIPSDWKGSLPHSFGGGLRLGGCSEEAFGLLTNIFAFKYMGDARYEFGALPGALNRITENRSNYIGFSIDVLDEDVERNDCGDSVRVRQKQNPEETNQIQEKYTIYIICHKAIKNDYEKYMRLFVTKVVDHHLDIMLFQKIPSWCPIGGLDETNGAFFFVDKEIFDKTRELWKIEIA